MKYLMKYAACDYEASRNCVIVKTKKENQEGGEWEEGMGRGSGGVRCAIALLNLYREIHEIHSPYINIYKIQ